MTKSEQPSEHPDIYGKGSPRRRQQGASLRRPLRSTWPLPSSSGARTRPDATAQAPLLRPGGEPGLFEEPAFSERIEAWQYGPVVRRGRALHGLRRRPDSGSGAGRADRLDKRLSWVVDRVVAEFGHQSGVALARLAKVVDGPWQIARGTLGPEAPSDNEITQASMRDYHRCFGLNPEAGLSAEEHALAERFLNGDRQSLDLLVESVLGVKPSAG